MQFSTLAVLSGLSALAAATPVHTVDAVVDFRTTVEVVCTDPAPSTVTQYVTVTAPPSPPANPTWGANPVWVTVGGWATSVDYHGPQSTVYVCPTGYSNRKCTKAIYEQNIVIDVIIINIDVQINNQGSVVTVTNTVTDVVTSTPPPPPPPTTTPPPPPPASTTAVSSSTSTSSTSTSSAPSSGTTHVVQVGVDGTLAYGPNQLNANIGDIVRFQFLKLNHTVTQSSFAKPCTPLEHGFDSGFTHFNPKNETTLTQDFPITTTSPLWFYCRQTIPNSAATHCTKGMVLGINPGNKFDAFLANAESSGSLPSNATVAAATVTPAKRSARPSKIRSWSA